MCSLNSTRYLGLSVQQFIDCQQTRKLITPLTTHTYDIANKIKLIDIQLKGHMVGVIHRRDPPQN